jgi:pimeloyl-[acyl-carrier protein] methyl ester esterase
MTSALHPIHPRLVLVHGWSFDPGIWQGLRAALPEFESVTIDLGFFGLPAGPVLPPDRPVVAVGHSLGVLWLLKTRPFPWAALVSINGFPRFVDGPDYAPAVPKRQVERMIRRLAADPAGVAEEFRFRCGATGPFPDGPMPESLLAGLTWLRDWDARPAIEPPPQTPLLALSGSDDPILPAGMDAHCFDGFPGLVRQRLDGGGHLLPITEPEWCAAAIRSFIAGLSLPS